MDAALQNWFESHQVSLRDVSGVAPLILGPQYAWLVVDGSVDIFVQELDEQDTAVGPRQFLLHRETGQVLPPWPTSSASTTIRLVAAGEPGTRVIAVDRELFNRELRQQSSLRDAVEEWLLGLLHAIANTDQTGVDQRLPEKLENDLRLKQGSTLGSTEGVFLLQVNQGSWFGGGYPHWSLETGELIPISPDFFSTTASDTVVTCRPLQALFEAGGLAAVDKVHVQVQRHFEHCEQSQQQQEWRRLDGKASQARRVMGGALLQMAGTLDESGAVSTATEVGDDPLLAACRMVADAMEIEVSPGISADSSKLDLTAMAQHGLDLDRIARASRFRYRRIVLKGQWWLEDSGPLLSFLEDQSQPVALLRDDHGNYRLVEPGKSSARKVNAKVAEQLTGEGYMFYRHLPEHALTLKDLIAFSTDKRSRSDIRTIIWMGLFGGLLAMLTPIATGVIFDTIIPGAEREQMFQILFGLLAIAIGSAMFLITRAIAVARIEGRTDASLQAAVWNRLLELPAPFFRQFSAGELAERAMGISRMRQVLSGYTVGALMGGLFASFNLLLLFYYDLQLALIALVVVSVGIAVTGVCGFLQMRSQEAVSLISQRIAGMVLQFITGVSKLRVSGTESRAFAMWSDQFSQQKRLTMDMRVIQNRLTVFNSAYPVLASVVIFGFYAYQLKQAVLHPDIEVMTTGQFVAFNAAFGAFVTAMISTSEALVSSLVVIPMYKRSKPILEALPEVDTGKAQPPRLKGKIEVSHLVFRYSEDGPMILKDVSLRVEPGEFVAIVGGSGSGKSTLFRLLLGFEHAESGSIFYDNLDLSSLDIRSVRKQCGVVLQNAQLMAGDVFTNIVGHNSAMSQENAWEAAQMAGLDGDIKALPMGMQTVISEGGGGFSGGQKQRLVIARAIVHRPRVLFFDEATSALDNRTQAIVSDSLDKLESSRIVIAHRLSTIRNADRIYVLDAGRIVESGDYDSLMANQGPFAELAKRQIA